MESARAYEKVLSKVIHVDNSRAVLSAVASGSAEAGLAFTSDADRSEQLQTLFRVPHAKAAAEYFAGVVRGGKQPAEARSLLEFITSPVAAKYFRRCGLRPV